MRSDGGRVFANKQRVCLVSFCESNADCPTTGAAPTASHCVNGNGVAQSFCSNGVRGAPCLKPVDCNSNTCAGADGSAFGTCN